MKNKDSFENGYFWELYLDLERQFEVFLEYVPYLEGNVNVYSFKLLNLILSIGGHVDSAFLEMARYSEFAQDPKCQKILKKKENFDKYMKYIRENKDRKKKRPSPPGLVDYLRTFEPIYTLSKKQVIFKRLPEREPLTLFEKKGSNLPIPIWWDMYNNVKHDLGFNIKEANLKNARDALATAFLLNAVHTPSALRLLEYDVLKTGIYREGPQGRKYQFSKSQAIRALKERKKFPGITSTKIFIFDYNK